MAAGPCFSMLALLLVCAVWGAWLNYIATAQKARNKVYWLKYKTTQMSCCILKGFLFCFFFFNWDFQSFIVSAKEQIDNYNIIVVYAFREHELVTSATCTIACTSVNFANSFVDLTAYPRFTPFVRPLAIARGRSWPLWATIGCFAI